MEIIIYYYLSRYYIFYISVDLSEYLCSEISFYLRNSKFIFMPGCEFHSLCTYLP